MNLKVRYNPVTVKIILPLLFIARFFFSCSQPASAPQSSTANPDSIAAQLEELREQYRPGLGELMSGIQMHHAKLWFAGINNNWKLSEYEIGEIKERVDEAVEIETNRPEVKMISIINPAIESVEQAIKTKNSAAFKNSFQNLTDACNNCHTINHFEFNVITIPTAPPVTNQDFKAR